MLLNMWRQILFLSFLCVLAVQAQSFYYPYSSYVDGQYDTELRDVLLDSQNNTFVFGPGKNHLNDYTKVAVAKYSMYLTKIWEWKVMGVAFNASCFSPDESTLYAAGSIGGFGFVVQINSSNGAEIQRYNSTIPGEFQSITLCDSSYVCVMGLQKITKLSASNLTEVAWSQTVPSNLTATIKYHTSGRLFMGGDVRYSNGRRAFFLAEISLMNGSTLFQKNWPNIDCGDYVINNIAMLPDGIVFVGTSVQTFTPNGTAACSWYRSMVAGKVPLTNLSSVDWYYTENDGRNDIMGNSLDVDAFGNVYLLGSIYTIGLDDWKLVFLGTTGTRISSYMVEPNYSKDSGTAIRVRPDASRIALGINRYPYYYDTRVYILTATADPSVSPSPSCTPSTSPSPSRTPSVTPSVSSTPSVTPSSSASPSPTASVTPSASATPSVTPTASITPTASATPSMTPSITPSPSATASITPSVSSSASVTPTSSISPTASATPSSTTSITPSITPSTSSTTSNSDKNSKSTTPIIVGVVVGVAGAGVIAGVLAFAINNRRKRLSDGKEFPMGSME